MANEINMAEKQTIAVLHARGVSNRQIAEILQLDRGTVNRQVRLLKIQNRPEAPPGKSSANQAVLGAGVTAEESIGGTDAGVTEEAEKSGPECSQQVVVEEQAGGISTGERAVTSQAPAGDFSQKDVIWEEEADAATWRSAVNLGQASAVARLQNRPEAPPGKFSQKELFDTVPRLAFATWEDPLTPLGRDRDRTLVIENQPEAPSGKSPGKDGLKEGETGSESRQTAPAVSDQEGPQVTPSQPEAPLGKTAENFTISGESASAGDPPSRKLSCVVSGVTPCGTKQPGVTTSLCTEFHELIVAMLERGLEAQRIWQDLVNDHGFSGKYWSVKRYVAKLRGCRPLPFRRLETAAGVEAQVDFGQGAWVLGPDGKRRRPWVFRVILSHSRKGYSEVVWRQTTEMFIDCLENAFRHFGGVPERIVLDNLKAAVTKADWYDPEIHPKIQSFAAHHGTVFLPTKPYTPRHKGKIEGGVKYVQNNALAGRSFASLEDQNEYLWRWESQVADQRIHGTTKRQVRALFEEQERAALRPLP
ncbi:MAG: IS21 family transposase, partial [Planctomycetaceae bacterium]